MQTHTNTTTYYTELRYHIQSNSFQTEADILLACHLALQLPKADLEEIIPPFQKCAEALSTYSYEIQAALAKVFAYLDKANYLPNWQTFELIPYVELAWLKTHLTLKPKEAIHYPNKKLLAKAITGISTHTKANFNPILEASFNELNFAVQLAHFDLLEIGMKTPAIEYAVFQKCTLNGLKSNEVEIVEKAAHLIMEAPFAFPECPEVPIRILLERKEKGLAKLAIQILSKWPKHPFIRTLLKEDWGAEVTKAIIAACAINPQEEDIPYIIQAMKKYPIDQIGKTLQKYAQKGYAFKLKEQAYLLEQYLLGDQIPLELITNIQALHSKLLDFDSSLLNFKQQKKWIRFLGDYTSNKAAEKLVDLLSNEHFKEHFALILQSLEEQQYREAELAILDQFTSHPKACLKALKSLGGQASIDRMKELIEFDKAIKMTVPSWEKEAVELLFFLSDDHLSILQYLEKNGLYYKNEFIEKLQLKSSNEFIPYLSQIINEEKTADLALSIAIEKLGVLGDIGCIPNLIQHLNHPDEEIQLIAWIQMKKIAVRAYQNESIRPRFLLNWKQDKGVNYLLSKTILKAIQNESRSSHIQGLLSRLSSVVSMPAMEEDIDELLAHKDPHIIKFVLECLGNTASKKVLTKIAKFIHPQQDIYTLRQALIGLKKLPNNDLEEQVIPLLYHRNMNIKKTAAAYLEEQATLRSLDDLLHWLKIHDNTGFRLSLNTALRKVLGDYYYFFMTNEIERSNSLKEQELLASTIVETIGFKYIKINEELTPKLYQTTAYQEWKEKQLQMPTIEKPKQFIKHYQSSIDELQLAVEEEPNSKDLIKQWRNISTQLNFNRLALKSIYPHLRKIINELSEDWESITAFVSKWKPILSTSEARIILSQNNKDRWAQEILFLDVKAEEMQFDHMLQLQPDSFRDQVIIHSLQQEPLAEILSYLIENDKSVLILENAINKYANNLSPKLCTSLRCFYWNMDSPKVANYRKVEKELGDWILKLNDCKDDELVAKRMQIASKEAQLSLLLSGQINPSEYQAEVNSLYSSLNLRQKSQLLSNLAYKEGFDDLFNRSFEKYLNGEKSVYWENKKLDQKQIYQLIKHPNCISIVEDRKENLKAYPDEFLKELIQEADIWSEKNDLSQRLKALQVERVWGLIKEGIAAKNWNLLYLLNDYKPIVPELSTLLSTLHQSEKEILFDWLLQFPKPIRFPALEHKLLEYVQSWANPVLAWRVLFSLDVWSTDQCLPLSKELIHIFAESTNANKTLILEILLADSVKPLLNLDSFKQAIKEHSSNDTHHLLRLNALLEGANWSDSKQAGIGVEHLIELQAFDPKRAIHHFESVKEGVAELSLSDQAQLLEQLYPHSIFEKEVTIHIAQIITTEVLFLDSLKEENQARFKTAINTLILNNKIPQEINQSQLLKNLFQEPNKSLVEVIQKLLFDPHDKKARNLYLRLLKKALPKSEYLEINAEVLHFSDPHLLRQAIRTLTYANYHQATSKIIPLLYHAKREVCEAAEAGLLHLGEKALPMLIKAVAKARPDKRDRMEEIIERIHL